MHRAIIIDEDKREICRFDNNYTNLSIEEDLANALLFFEYKKGFLNIDNLIIRLNKKRKIDLNKTILLFNKKENIQIISKDIVNELKIRFSKDSIIESLIKSLE